MITRIFTSLPMLDSGIDHMFSLSDPQSQEKTKVMQHLSDKCRFPVGPKDHLDVACSTVLTNACLYIWAHDYSDNLTAYIRAITRLSGRYKSRDTSPTAPTSNNSSVSVHICTSDICSVLGVSQVVHRRAIWQHGKTSCLGDFEWLQMPEVIKCLHDKNPDCRREPFLSRLPDFSAWYQLHQGSLLPAQDTENLHAKCTDPGGK